MIKFLKRKWRRYGVKWLLEAAIVWSFVVIIYIMMIFYGFKALDQAFPIIERVEYEQNK